MSTYEASSDSGGAADGREDEAASSGAAPFDAPILDGTRQPWVILKRNRQRMVLFCGWPEPGLLHTFGALRMAIGLALNGADFSEQRPLADCSYLFIGRDNRPSTAFALALRDLSRANWSIDRDASWPVIAGGYQPHQPADSHQSRAAEQAGEQRRRQRSRKPERMEA